MLNLKPFKLPPRLAAVIAVIGKRGWKMKDGGWSRRLFAILYPLSSILVFIAAAGGCAGKPDAGDQLEQGYADLESRNYDAAIAKADAFLAANTSGGTGSAEALYLRGRALEQKVAANPAESKQNLQSARSAYIDALSRDPSPALEGRIRASLANVAYFQDDYSTALNQWSAAYDKLDVPETRAWVLYRIGVSHQRLGHFKEADKTFAAVMKEYPNTLPAQRAKERQGASGFFVQIGTFNSAAGADRATEEVRKQGVAPVRVKDTQGRHLLRVGPLTTYAQAQSIKSKFADTYPDAMILP